MAELYALFEERAKRFSKKTALIAGGKHYTYGEALMQARCGAGYLIDLLGEGQRPRVALLLEDPFLTISVSLAIAALDGVCIPVNPQMLPEQLAAGWQAADVNVVIYESAFAHKVGKYSADDVHLVSADQFARCDDVGRLPDDLSFAWSAENDFLITLSSGSTGAPKPIVVSQKVKVERARQTWDLYGLTSDDVVLCASPYFHSLGQRLFFVPLLLGATLVHLAKFTPRIWLDSVEKHKVSFVISVSSHLYALKDFLLNSTQQIDSLKTIVTSSAPIDAHFKDQLFKAVGCDFHEIYGATEVAIVSNLAPEYSREKYATVGLPCEGVDVRILAEDGRQLAVGDIGEIAVKSPLAFESYYGHPDLTERAFSDGYFLTGDLGFFDGDGFLSYVSRKKDVIISGGINIYPKDIEDVLGQHPDLTEISVIGVEDSLLGEVVVAIYVSSVCDNIESQLMDLSNKQLAPFQRPLRYFGVAELPRTPSGKVSKIVLREKYNSLNDNWTLPLKMLLYGD